MMETMKRIALDRGLMERLGRGALDFSAPFTWERAADETEAHLLGVLEDANRDGPAMRG